MTPEEINAIDAKNKLYRIHFDGSYFNEIWADSLESATRITFENYPNHSQDKFEIVFYKDMDFFMDIILKKNS